MAFCRKCGAENSGNGKFCKNCGAELDMGPVQEQNRQALPGAGEALCPNCGKPVPSRAKYCKSCGSRLDMDRAEQCAEQQMPKAGRTCPNCGKPIPSSVKFCKNCGARLESPPVRQEPKPKGNHRKSKKLPLGIAAAVCAVFLLFLFIGGDKDGPKGGADPLDESFSDAFGDEELELLFGDDSRTEGETDFATVIDRLDIAGVFNQQIITADDLKGPPMTEEERIEYIRESLASETDADVSDAEVPLPPENLNRENLIYGSLEEDGIEVQIPAGAIDDDIRLEIVKTEDGGIDISAPGYENGIMLWEPATIRMALSEPVGETEYLNYVGIYEGENGTETFAPSVDGLNDQVLEIQTTHFSKFNPRRHTNEECSEYFSEKFAGRHVDRDFALQTQKDHTKSIEDIIAEGYKAMGMKDPELINYLAQQAAGEILGESMTYNAVTGDHVTLADNASKTAVSTYLEYCVKFADDTEKKVAIGNSTYYAGNIGKYAMAAIKGGMTDGSLNGAFEETMKTFATNIPAVKWGKMAADIAVISRNMLTRDQAENFYKRYEEFRDNNKGIAHDSDFMDQYGQRFRNYLSQCNIDAIQAYDKIPYHTFTEKYPGLAKKICAHTQDSILKNLRNRYDRRNEKADLQHHYKVFIDYLFKHNLIKKGDLNRAFNNGKFYSAEEYLDKMLYARRSILDMMGGDIKRFGDKPEKQEKNLGSLAYVYLHSGNAADGRMEVLKYLYRDATGRLQLRKTDKVYEEAKKYAEEEDRKNQASEQGKEKQGYWKRTGRTYCSFTPESKTDHYQGARGEHHSVHERFADCTETSFNFHTYIDGSWWAAGMYDYRDSYQKVAVIFSEPAQSYRPGETVCVNVSTSLSEGGPEYYHEAWAHAYAVILKRSYEEIVEHDCGGAWPGAQNLTGKNGEKVEYDPKENNSFTLYGKMPEGRPGEKICIRYDVYVSSIGTGESAGSVFEYEWVE